MPTPIGDHSYHSYPGCLQCIPDNLAKTLIILVLDADSPMQENVDRIVALAPPELSCLVLMLHA